MDAIDCVAVTAGLTASVRVEDVLVAKLESPLNMATIEWLPTGSVVVQVATPLETAAAPHPEIVDPSGVNATVLSLTVDVPVTVAVNVSVCG